RTSKGEIPRFSSDLNSARSTTRRTDTCVQKRPSDGIRMWPKCTGSCLQPVNRKHILKNRTRPIPPPNSGRDRGSPMHARSLFWRLSFTTWLLGSLAYLVRGSEPAPVAPSSPAQLHWAFQKTVRPALPQVRAADWVRTPIDAFVLARLEAAGLTPSPAAERFTLLRRVTFDLSGLPPTPAEVDAFLRDDRPDAYERVVDRLLASPHYGERWAQHWLDVV